MCPTGICPRRRRWRPMTEYTPDHHPVKIWSVRSGRKLEMRGACSCSATFRAPRIAELVAQMRIHATDARKP